MAPETSICERRVRLLLAYDGRPHGGWQFVGDGRSVQEAVECAVMRILKSPNLVRVHASGRTDAGVHALGQVVHFAVPAEWRMDGGAWCRALNSLLPVSIRVLDAADAEPGFHARHQATGKHYRYRVFNGPELHPLDAGYVWHWPWPLDVPAMRSAARLLVGEHDFSAFAAFRHDGTDRSPGSGKNIRQIWHVTIQDDLPPAHLRTCATPPSHPGQCAGSYLNLDFTGSGFLYKMVRLLVGALLHVGRGSLDEMGLRALLACRLNAQGEIIKSPLCAAADGLYMVRVFYGDDVACP